MEVEVRDDSVRATGASGAVTVATEAWRASRGAGSPGPADAVVDGAARSLSFVPSRVFLRRVDDDGPAVATDAAGDRVRLGRPGSTRLGDGAYRLRVAGAVDTVVRFDGPATLATEHGAVVLRFEAPEPVSIGFRDAAEDGDGAAVVTVPRTVEGVAAALSALGGEFRTATAARSAPSMRGRPPRVAFGDAVMSPAGDDGGSPAGDDRDDVRLVCPPELPYLFTAAPLATYLDAAVTTDAAAEPRVTYPGGSVALGRLPEFQRAANDLLRRVFLLDCLSREEPLGGPPPAERALLDEVGIDRRTVADAPVGERLDAYLAAPFDRISPRLPEWHLSMYVEPTFDAVATLSRLLADLPYVFLPEAEPLGGDERLARSLDDFYRGADGGVPPSPEVDAVKPVLGPGRIHGWLADGVPIDVFKSLPEAYAHRDRLDRPDRPDRDGPLSVVAVLNDTDMIEEYADLDGAYGRDAGDAGVDVRVRKRLTRAELAATFERDHDLVHYIGHCEPGGLRCTDGALSTDDVSTSGARAFLLNACGSYYEGVDLVRKGSVAGAVTFNKVLDRHAARVGTTFVRLLVRGFSIERALDLARRRIIMGSDYAVVGDGTHALVDPDGQPPADATLRRVPDDGGEEGRYRLTVRASDARGFGGTYAPAPPLDSRPLLVGNERETVLDAAETVRFLRSANLPVVFEGDIHWADDLADRLAAGRPRE